MPGAAAANHREQAYDTNKDEAKAAAGGTKKPFYTTLVAWLAWAPQTPLQDV